MLRLLTKSRTLASDCVSLASRPGLSGLGKMVAQCTRIAYVVWRGLRLLTTWRKSFVSYASARVSMSKICNRYLAKIDIWYNSNLWLYRQFTISRNYKKIKTERCKNEYFNLLFDFLALFVPGEESIVEYNFLRHNSFPSPIVSCAGLFILITLRANLITLNKFK